MPVAVVGSSGWERAAPGPDRRARVGDGGQGDDSGQGLREGSTARLFGCRLAGPGGSSRQRRARGNEGRGRGIGAVRGIGPGAGASALAALNGGKAERLPDGSCDGRDDTELSLVTVGDRRTLATPSAVRTELQPAGSMVRVALTPEGSRTSRREVGSPSQPWSKVNVMVVVPSPLGVVLSISTWALAPATMTSVPAPARAAATASRPSQCAGEPVCERGRGVMGWSPRTSRSGWRTCWFER